MPRAAADELLMEPGIDAAGREQCLVGATLDDAARVQHQVGLADRAETMGNHKLGPTAEQQFQRLLQSRFRHAVNGAGRFVEHHDARLAMEVTFATCPLNCWSRPANTTSPLPSGIWLWT